MSDMAGQQSPGTSGPVEMLQELKRSKWPTTLGVISLIYALLGLMCQAVSCSYMVFGNSIPEMFRGGAEFPPMMRLVGGVQASLTFVIGLVMLLGAVRLLQRRRSSAGLLKTWVVLRLTLALAGFVGAYAMIPANVQLQRSVERYMEKMAAEHPGRIPAQPQMTDEQIGRKAILTSGVMTLMFTVYPCFLGFWMSRRTVADEVACWD